MSDGNPVLPDLTARTTAPAVDRDALAEVLRTHERRHLMVGKYRAHGGDSTGPWTGCECGEWESAIENDSHGFLQHRAEALADAVLTARDDDARYRDGWATALRAAADEMDAVIMDGDVAEVAVGVPGEVNRSRVVAKRDALYEEPATWLREYAARSVTADDNGEGAGCCPSQASGGSCACPDREQNVGW